MKTVLVITLCTAGLLTAEEVKSKPTLPERVKAFTEKYTTEEAVEKRHKEWIAEDPASADAYILPANAMLKMASSVTINAGTGNKAFANLVDPKTGKVVGSISEEPDVKLQKRAVEILTAAVAKFPQRLDIHVGRMVICQSSEDPVGLEQAALTLLSAAEKQGDKLRWADDALIDGPVSEKVISEVHPRISWLYAKEKPETDEAASRVSLAALKLYPKDVRLLNDAAIFHAYREEWEKAREFFLQASAVDPKDMLVQHNIAMSCLRLGDQKQAIERWKAIIAQVPGTDEAKRAQSEIDKLSPKPKKKKK